MIGALQPAASSRFLISGTAAAASGTFTVQRTISEPASDSSIVCLNVDSISAVSVLVIDCTTIGAPPPTLTWPTFTPYVFRRGCREAAASNPLIWVSIIPSILADAGEIGGRIHIGLDKTNNYEFFSRQNVIKPALLGLAGPGASAASIEVFGDAA